MAKDVKGSLKEAGEKVSASIDEVKDKVQDTVDQVKDKVQDAAGQVKDKVQDTVDQVKDKGQEIKDQAKKHFGTVDDVKNKAGQRFEDFAGITEDEFSQLYGSDDKIENFMNFVRDRPVMALVLATVFGVILSKMLRCCRRRKC